MKESPYLFDIEPYTRRETASPRDPGVDRALRQLEATLTSLPREELARRRRRWRSLVRSTARHRTRWSS
jgi:hypothetical protein